MPDELNLTLPERKQKHTGGSRSVPLLLVLVLIVGIVNLVFSLKPGPEQKNKKDGGLGPVAGKELALKLENQGLRGAAAP